MRCPLQKNRSYLSNAALNPRLDVDIKVWTALANLAVGTQPLNGYCQIIIFSHRCGFESKIGGVRLVRRAGLTHAIVVSAASKAVDLSKNTQTGTQHTCTSLFFPFGQPVALRQQGQRAHRRRMPRRRNMNHTGHRPRCTVSL